MVKNDIIVPDTDEFVVKCLVKTLHNHENAGLEKPFIFTPDRANLLKRNLLGSHELVSLNDGNEIPVRFAKLQNCVRKLYKDTRIGFIEEVYDVIDDHNMCSIQLSNQKQHHIDDVIQYHTTVDVERSAQNKTYMEKALREFSNVFSLNDMDLGFTDVYRHTINTGDTPPIAVLPRRIPMAVEHKLDEQIEQLLENNIIRESNSPWNSPVVVVAKKNGDIRMCVDYRNLNSVTDKEVFPIPDARHLFDNLQSNTVFSTIDLSKGYYQVAMHPKDIPKTAFATRKGHYEFLRLPFGLNGAPASFQKIMHTILRKENWSMCQIYLDDIIIYGKDPYEHYERLRIVLDKIQKSGLKLSPFKCNFMLSEIKYLGHIISKDGIQTDPEKLKVIKEWPIPVTENQLISFLGFCGYYRRFIKDYANLTSPLEKICNKKNKNEISWNDEAVKAFNTLKGLLILPPVLSFPNDKDIFILDTDASDVALGAVLSQLQAGEERVIAYASHTLTKSERQYCVTRRELLAVYKYILHFKHYLFGKKFLVRTDHKALTWLLKWENPSTSQYCRWKTDLEAFTFDVEYREGSKHINADFLSRPPCGQCELIHENPRKRRNVKCFYEDNPINDMVMKMTKNEEFCWQQEKDKNIMVVIHRLKDSALHIYDSSEGWTADAQELWRQRKRLRIRGGLLYYISSSGEYALIVPQFKRKELLDCIHRSMAHIGSTKMYETLKNKYFWPNMLADIRNRLNACISCCHVKENKYGVTQLQPVVTNTPFERIAIDIAGPLPPAYTGDRYILGVIDYFSKFSMLIPLKSIDAITVSRALLQRWISVFGIPQSINSDRGSNFESDLFASFSSLLGIRKTRSTPYHPKSNGAVERLFRTSKQLIRVMCYKDPRKWVDTIPIVEMSLRSSVSMATTHSPYEVLFGRKMCTTQDINYPNSINDKTFNDEDEYIIWLKNAIKVVHASVKDATNAQAKNMVKHQMRVNQPFKIGDTVMVKVIESKKTTFGERYHGPFTIEKMLGKYSYRLSKESGEVIDRHQDNLKPCNEIKTKGMGAVVKSTIKRKINLPIRYGFKVK